MKKKIASMIFAIAIVASVAASNSLAAEVCDPKVTTDVDIECLGNHCALFFDGERITTYWSRYCYNTSSGQEYTQYGFDQRIGSCC